MEPYYKATWQGIKSRCYNPNFSSYKNYGARGIRMHYEWVDSCSGFNRWLLENLGPRPDNYSLDRINNDGHYEPGNLRWADQITQANNRRHREEIVYKGQLLSQSQCARELGVSRQYIHQVKKGQVNNKYGLQFL